MTHAELLVAVVQLTPDAEGMRGRIESALQRRDAWRGRFCAKGEQNEMMAAMVEEPDAERELQGGYVGSRGGDGAGRGAAGGLAGRNMSWESVCEDARTIVRGVCGGDAAVQVACFLCSTFCAGFFCF